MKNIKVSIILPVYNVEKYLAQTLDSFQRQTMDEFEVIMIDDGSTDSSAEIMKKYAAGDERFRCFFQENKGVSETRNRGIGLAEGEYLAFYDSDDWIRPNVLEKMYGTAKTQRADIVVGAMEEFSAAGENIYAETIALASKEEINRFDEKLIWTFSLANKLFRKKLIDDNGLQLDHIAYSEDGLFLFRCVSKAQKIAGCSIVAYEYRKQPLWSGRSVTQQTNEKLFHDFIYAYENVIKVMAECIEAEISRCLAEGAAEGILNELRMKKIKCISELYYKLELNIIRDFYRQLWQTDDVLEKRIIDKFEEYKCKLFGSSMELLIHNNIDLNIAGGLQTKEQLAATPLVTAAVTANVSKEYVNRVLYSIYSQTLTAFEVFVQKDLEPYVDAAYKDKINLKFVAAASAAEYKNTVLRCANSGFINIIDENIMLPENMFRNMYVLHIESGSGFVTVPIRKIDGNSARLMKCNVVLYLGKYMDKKLPLNLSLLDNILGNKLLSAAQLNESGFSFTDNAVSDVQWFYENLDCKKRADTCVFSFFGEKFLLSRTKKLLPKISYKFVKNLQLLKDKKVRHDYIIGMQQKILNRLVKLRDIAQKHCVIRKRVFFYTPRGNELLGNSKVLYDALDCKKAVFAKAGKRSKLDQWKVTYYLLTSKVIVTDDYCTYMKDVELRPEQKLVQIWHACGAFKRFGLDYLLNDRQSEKAIHGQYDVVCVSSENVRADYAGAFGVGIDKVQALGVPRTDIFYDSHAVDEMKSRFYAQYPELGNKRIILYCPTFREKNGIKVLVDARIDWDAFSKTLPEGTVMLIKNHPVVKGDMLGGKRYHNIQNTSWDTNTLMLAADIMVTDYSSVIFECCIIGRPIIFYCPDYDEYERDFYLEFPKDTYGDFTFNQEELCEAVVKNLKEPNLENLAAFKEKYMGACDGHSTKRIADMIGGFVSGGKYVG